MENLPADRVTLEAIAAELAVAERAVAGRLAAVRALEGLARQAREPRNRHQAAQTWIAAELARLAPTQTGPAPALIASGPYLVLPDRDLSAGDYYLALYKALIALARAARAKLAELPSKEQHGPKASSDAIARPPRHDPATRALAEAYSLKKAGKPVSVRSACEAAGVDRKNLTANHPEIIRVIEQLGQPDRRPPKGMIDWRTGNLEAQEDDGGVD